MKFFINKIFSRLVIVSLSLLFQIAVLVLALVFFRQEFAFVQAVFVLLGFCLTIHIVSGNRNAGYKIAWLIPILVLPVFGILIYFLFGRHTPTRAQRTKLAELEQKVRVSVSAQAPAWEILAGASPSALRQATYLETSVNAPVYANTYTEYLPQGEVMYARMLEEIARAKHFIFLEYFILAEGSLWDELRTLLLQKKAEGVDIRIIFDDLGSIRRLPADFPSRLERMGFRCRVFHRFRPFLTGSFNSRDHRKILIIDGHTAFTGGMNLADEYINRTSPYGHWLDAGVLLRGAGVWSFTVMFLSMWENLGPGDRDYSPFRPEEALVPVKADGFVQPFSDEPLDDEPVGKLAYLNLISRAERYVYICTPYLIPDNDLVTALIAAAKSGVDVRIITPGVPDKWFVHTLGYSYYPELIRAGVRVYEYTPGFIHSKTVVCDDEFAICGTINFDYRSFYLQYECGVWMYRTQTVGQMHEDFFRTLERCEEITLAHCGAFPLAIRILQRLLRIFAPLL